MLLGKYDIYVCTYSHLSNKRAGWNKRVIWEEFHMKKCKQGESKILFITQKKSISEASRLLDKLSQKITVYAKFANTTNYVLKKMHLSLNAECRSLGLVRHIERPNRLAHKTSSTKKMRFKDLI